MDSKPADGLAADGFMTASKANVESVCLSTASAPPPIHTDDGCSVAFDKFVQFDASCVVSRLQTRTVRWT